MDKDSVPLTLADIRSALVRQGFSIYQDRDGNYIICTVDYRVVATQPGNVRELRETVLLGLDYAGFMWP